MTSDLKPRRASSKSNKYEETYRESIENPPKFWKKIGKLLSWNKPWNEVVDNKNEPFTKWFVGGELNACFNAVDRHVEAGIGNKTALIFDSPLTETFSKITYRELQIQVSKLASVLASYGVTKGDRVLIYMPIIPETIMAMLATARLGAVHSVVFGGFASYELASRLEHSEAKVIIAANCGIEPQKIVKYMDYITEAIAISNHKPTKCIIYQRSNIMSSYLDGPLFIDWESAIEDQLEHPCIPIEANDPLYILYTSGTTGNPKGVQRPIGGHLATVAWTMKTIYGLDLDDVWWAVSDFGWAVGHSYMCYGPLLCGMTNVIYEGKPTTTPDPSSYFRILDQYKVNAAFMVPTVLRLLKKEDYGGNFATGYDLSHLRRIFVAGEHCDLNSKLWAEKIFGVPVFNHWWQTETGHAITATCVGLEQIIKSDSLSVGYPFPGYNIQILREDGSKASTCELGRIVVKLPLPPGTLTTLYKDEEKFLDIYFSKYKGFYDTMDVGYLDESGLVHVTARDDDVINVAGHRLSTLQMENAILSHPDIGEACVVSVPDYIKGEIPFCFFVKKGDSSTSEDLISQEIIDIVRETIGPIASFKLAAAVKALPQTRSGKICRKSISNLAKNNLVKIPSTVVDASVYEEIKNVLCKWGFGQEITSI